MTRLCSSDVISDLRINVQEERSGAERFLSDTEIVENVYDNATSTLLWTIHRPKRGWYTRIRSPSFPPNVFIPLLPIPRTSPYFVDTALTVACRTNRPSPSSPLSPILSPTAMSPAMTPKVSMDSQQSSHSYPPTPPAMATPDISVSPPSPEQVKAKLASLGSASASSSSSTNGGDLAGVSNGPSSRRISRRTSSRPAPAANTQITQFLLAPEGSTAHLSASPPPASWWSRVWSLVASNAPSNSLSFSLTPLPPLQVAPIPSSVALITLTDLTPTLTVYRFSGLLAIDEAGVKELGVETSFWVAVSLAYIDFLGERESYLAALAD
ncbi:hypothetical protein PUNSTDRAFT_115667 [Punctularia strigosozonata HHB-11173 SS5]|uniref:uncharacterized protein n=1 Tax=Punctularia strigosozonata (strain HHB-11173) TaxID=741275 RepID=UPI00044169C2|nr:uncharacterized protein PUNSTDRAFT_115667 [Punctularia strigosozonata HHB-11173 SS5]EIN05720.1 hypothetical protein PUNSTDRAFT_115667 [Punctularia strigosozonata HHB-11173 SS5]